MHRNFVAGLIATLACWPMVSSAGANHGSSGQSELLVFASAEALRTTDRAGPASSIEGLGSLDVLGSWTSGRFRVMGELVLATDEQDMERLQLGWQLVPETMVWVGRFHQPGSPWATHQHHGQYLQETISRPAIEDWEDEGGVVPQHVEGLLVESRMDVGSSSGLTVSAGAGVSAELGSDGLQPFEVFDPRSTRRLPAYSVQIGFLPDYSGENVFGVVASRTGIPVSDSNAPGVPGRVDLSMLGAFVNLDYGSWGLVSTLYSITTRLSGGAADGSDSMLAGYFQLLGRFSPTFSAVARYEGSYGADESPYLALFEDFAERRLVLALRWDFASKQALTAEWADSHNLHSGYHQYRVQWSAALR